ncbi:hypothetical protein [Nitritalea halalkaliphila]|uniref:hypothetical protein n=1 Tax=Nitritalea halalkaliphila TaxID=590849 RepID=UPI0002E5B3A2|nr:hypothetical protein [Nitritalea halalkaliphila]
MKKWFLCLVLGLFWQGSGLLAQQISGQELTRYQQLNELLGPTSFFDNHLSGFMLFDPDSNRLIFEKNSHMHFLPASTTKLLTFYASLVALKEAPAHLRYQELDAETLQIWGTGSPVWKYGTLPQPPIDALLKKYRVIYFSSANWKSTASGMAGSGTTTCMPTRRSARHCLCTGMSSPF